MKKIELTKSMIDEVHEKGITLNQVLEPLDVLEAGSNLKLDAVQRQMVMHGFTKNISLEEVKKDKNKRILLWEFMQRAIMEAVDGKVGGKGRFSILTEDGNAVIFPDTIETDVKTAIGQGDNYLALSDIVAINKNVEQTVVKNAYFNMTKLAASKVGRKRVKELGKFPVASIEVGTASTSLYKYGRKVKISYEAERSMQVDELKLALYAIAFQWQVDMVSDAVAVLLSGASDHNVATGGTIAYLDLLNLDLNYGKPFNPTVYIANTTGLGKIFAITQFQDSRLFDTAKSGIWPAPFGRKLRRFDSSDLDEDVLSIDSRFALRQLTQSGSVIREADKVIDGQWNEIVISLVRGWDLMHSGARLKLDFAA